MSFLEMIQAATAEAKQKATGRKHTDAEALQALRRLMEWKASEGEEELTLTNQACFLGDYGIAVEVLNDEELLRSTVNALMAEGFSVRTWTTHAVGARWLMVQWQVAAL